MTKTFCSEYLVLNSGTEIPDSFTRWCSLSAISACLARHVWLDMGPFKIYPNMYLVLIAGSGRMRKSTSINVTRDLLRALDPKPNLISQKMTPEALLKVLGETGSGDMIITNGKTHSTFGKSQGFLITDELTNFLNAKSSDGGINGLLIELYDCRDEFSYDTKTSGKYTLTNTQLGLLAATTPEELRKAIPEDAVGSGLASRILFVYEDKPMDPVPFPTYSDTQILAREFCVKSLLRIQSLSGCITLSEACRKWGDECYRERCFNSKLYEDPHLAGYASRRFVHILKLGILLTVGLTETLEVTPEMLNRAESLIVKNEGRLKDVIRLITMNEKGYLTHMVYSIIFKHTRVNREVVMTLLNHRIDSRELTEIIETLIRSGRIQAIANGSHIYYELKG